MTDKPTPPCHDCGSKNAERSACPLCGKVLCQRCAERPYAFCCEPEGDTEKETP